MREREERNIRDLILKGEGMEGECWDGDRTEEDGWGGYRT